jgi:hypothetical protein
MLLSFTVIDVGGVCTLSKDCLSVKNANAAKETKFFRYDGSGRFQPFDTLLSKRCE